MGKKHIIGLMLCTVLCSLPTQAATKNVQYYSPTFYYNGAQKYLENGIVVIDGVSYIPAKSFSNAIGVDFSWNTGTNTLTVNGTTSGNVSSQMALQAKDYEIASLKKELLNLQGSTSTKTSTSSTKASPTQGRDILGTELTETEKALEKAYGDYFDDISFDFDLRVSSSKLKATVSYETSTENREFNRLSNREIKDFVEEVCEEIRDYHEDIVIEGTIKYDNSNATKYYFTYSKKDRLSCGTSSNYDNDDDDDDDDDDITSSDVLRTLSGLDVITIDDYSGSVKIKEKKADVNDNRERIRMSVYLELNDEMKTALNNNKGTNNDQDLKDYLRDFSRRIKNETDYEDIQISVYSDTSQVAYYDYEENELYVYGI